MSAICVIIAIITSLSRDQLLTVGLSLVATAILHNSAGYVLGYAGARLVGLDESTRRTVAIEVGLQNGGMASALAVNTLQSAQAAMAPAIFGPWMNIRVRCLHPGGSRDPPRHSRRLEKQNKVSAFCLRSRPPREVLPGRSLV